jgi:hypothetical protein
MKIQRPVQEKFIPKDSFTGRGKMGKQTAAKAG